MLLLHTQECRRRRRYRFNPCTDLPAIVIAVQGFTGKSSSTIDRKDASEWTAGEHIVRKEVSLEAKRITKVLWFAKQRDREQETQTGKSEGRHLPVNENRTWSVSEIESQDKGGFTRVPDPALNPEFPAVAEDPVLLLITVINIMMTRIRRIASDSLTVCVCV